MHCQKRQRTSDRLPGWQRMVPGMRPVEISRPMMFASFPPEESTSQRPPNDRQLFHGAVAYAHGDRTAAAGSGTRSPSDGPRRALRRPGICQNRTSPLFVRAGDEEVGRVKERPRDKGGIRSRSLRRELVQLDVPEFLPPPRRASTARRGRCQASVYLFKIMSPVFCLNDITRYLV